MAAKRITKTTRIVLDAVLTVMMIAAMPVELTGIVAHEIIGFAFFAIIVVHLVFSAAWIKSAAKALPARKLGRRRAALAVMTVLLAADIVLLGLSSVAISELLAGAGLEWTWGTHHLWKHMHAATSWGLCALVCVHLAMHWAFLASALKVEYNPERRRAISVGVGVVAGIGAAVLGAFAVKSAVKKGEGKGQGGGQGQGRGKHDGSGKGHREDS